MGRFGWFDYGVVGGASLFLLLGGFLLKMGVQNLWRGYASEGWPKAPAVVVSSTTTSNTSYDSKARTRTTTYSADTRFRYRVDGREYSTATRHFGQTGGSADISEAEVLRFRYSPTAAITVSYNPADPSIAAAEPGFDSDALWLPGAGLAFAVPAIMFIVIWFGISRGRGNVFAVGLGIFAGIFMSLGGVMLAGSLTNLARAAESRKWPQVKGVIVYGQADKTLNATALPVDNDQYALSSGDRVVFRYAVDGHTYFSNIRRFGQVPESNHLDSDVPTLYPLGREVSVVYSPHNPYVSALETGPARGALWLPGAGAAFFLFGLAVFLFGIPALTR
jgi:hypothetical protein